MRRALFRPTEPDDFEDDPTTFDGIPIFDGAACGTVLPDDEPASEETMPSCDVPGPVISRPQGRGVWAGIAVGGVVAAAVVGVVSCGLAVGGAAVAWTLLDAPGQATITGLP